MARRRLRVVKLWEVVSYFLSGETLFVFFGCFSLLKMTKTKMFIKQKCAFLTRETH